MTSRPTTSQRRQPGGLAVLAPQPQRERGGVVQRLGLLPVADLGVVGGVRAECRNGRWSLSRRARCGRSAAPTCVPATVTVTCHSRAARSDGHAIDASRATARSRAGVLQSRSMCPALPSAARFTELDGAVPRAPRLDQLTSAAGPDSRASEQDQVVAVHDLALVGRRRARGPGRGWTGRAAPGSSSAS